MAGIIRCLPWNWWNQRHIWRIYIYINFLKMHTGSHTNSTQVHPWTLEIGVQWGVFSLQALRLTFWGCTETNAKFCWNIADLCCSLMFWMSHASLFMGHIHVKENEHTMLFNSSCGVPGNHGNETSLTLHPEVYSFSSKGRMEFHTRYLWYLPINARVNSVKLTWEGSLR